LSFKIKAWRVFNPVIYKYIYVYIYIYIYTQLDSLLFKVVQNQLV